MSLPIIDFLTQRLQEFDAEYELRQGTAFTGLFIEPTALIVQPLRDEANDIFINQSLKRILELDDPDGYPEDSVDAIVENLYVFRRTGNKAGGIARVLFQAAKDLNYIPGALQFTSVDGSTYINRNTISITAQEMTSNLDQEFFFLDIEIEAELEGSSYDAAANEIIETTEPDSVRVFNANVISGGVARETNTKYINRASRSIGERSLNNERGANAVFFETFANQLNELQAVGFGDPEMMRDIQFNYHIGGKTDFWVKTPQVLDGFFDVTGLTLDFTRRLSTVTNIVLRGTTAESLNVLSIDVTENPVRAFSVGAINTASVFYSYVDLEESIDLSNNEFVNVQIDSGELKTVKISGANPATTQIGEIVTRLNVAIGINVATIAVNPIVVRRSRTGNTGADNSTEFFDATPEIFANVFAGDIMTILVGDNAGTYIVASVPSKNRIILDTAIATEEAGINFRISRIGTFMKIQSPTAGISSRIFLSSPSTGTDGLEIAFGLVASVSGYDFNGKGEVEYQEAVDFNVDTTTGDVVRIIGSTILPNTITGLINKSIFFEDASSDIFLNVEAGDVLTIIDTASEALEKDYRILEKISNNRLRVDAFFEVNETNIEYRINRTGIKDEAIVKFTFDYNPLSIDIGDQVFLDSFGRSKGIRPGREAQTITDLALLYITSIELIDPVSGEPIGEVLEGRGGFGRGGFGRGGYGRGEVAEWFHQVNKPELRFSVQEDSYVVIAGAFLGQSFRVNYRYVPEIQSFQDLADSDSDRILGAGTLVKHFIPAEVDLTVSYSTDPNNPNTPTEEEVQATITSYIDLVPAGKALDASDIIDIIYSLIDPNRERNVIVQTPISMKATIYNTDASLTIVDDTNRLQIPEEEIPAFSPKPLSPRTAHWIAGTITVEATTVTQAGIA